MEDSLSSAEVTAIRHLVGLSARELAEEIGVHPRTVRGWEAEKYRITAHPASLLMGVRAAHDAALMPLIDGAKEGLILTFPAQGNERYPVVGGSLWHPG